MQGGLPADKIVVKPNYVLSDPRKGAGRGGYALFVGNLSPEKGIDVMLTAWQHLRNRMPLRIVGDGPLASRVRAATGGRHLVSRPVPEKRRLGPDAGCGRAYFPLVVL